MDRSKYDLLIWGKHPVLAAAESRFTRVHEVAVHRKDDPGFTTKLAGLLRSQGVRIQERGAEELKRICGIEKHQGVVARVTVAAFSSVREWAEAGKGAEDSTVGLVLDGVEDPQNVGTLWRAAAFFGAGFVLIPKDRAASMTGVVVKASAGAVFEVPMIRAVNLARELDWAADAGFHRIGLSVDAERPLDRLEAMKRPRMLILGNEAKGLRDLTVRKCDELVRIPGSGPMESLNVAVAGAIALYEIARKGVPKASQETQ